MNPNTHTRIHAYTHARTHVRTHARTQSRTQVPGWLVEMFANVALKQKRKNKPELVLMTRGFVVMERTLNDATPTTLGSSPNTTAGRQHGWGQPACGGTEHVQHSGLTVFGVRTKSTAKEIDEQTNLLYGLQVYPQ